MVSESTQLLAKRAAAGRAGSRRVGYLEGSVQDSHWGSRVGHVLVLLGLSVLYVACVTAVAWGDFVATTYVCELQAHLGLFAYHLECGDFFEDRGKLDCRGLRIMGDECTDLDVIRGLVVGAAALCVVGFIVKVAEAVACSWSPTLRLSKVQIFRRIASTALILSGIVGCTGVVLWCVALERVYEKSEHRSFLPQVRNNMVKSATLGWASVVCAVTAMCTTAIGINFCRASCRAAPMRQVFLLSVKGNGLPPVPESKEESEEFYV